MNRLPMKKNARWACPLGDPDADATITCRPSGREFEKSFVSFGVNPRLRTKLAAAVALEALSVRVGAVVGGVVAGTSGAVAGPVDADDGSDVLGADPWAEFGVDGSGEAAGCEVDDAADAAVVGDGAAFDESCELQAGSAIAATRTNAEHVAGAHRIARTVDAFLTSFPDSSLEYWSIGAVPAQVGFNAWPGDSSTRGPAI